MYRYNMGQMLPFIIKMLDTISSKILLNEYTLIWVEVLAYHNAVQFSLSIVLGKEIIQITRFFEDKSWNWEYSEL